MESINVTVGGLHWPLKGWPRVIRAVDAALDDRGFSHTYLYRETAAIHLYRYAGRVRMGDREFELQPGDVTLSPRFVPVRYDLPEPGRHLCCHLVPPDEEGPTARIPLHLRLGVAAEALRERFRALMQTHARMGDDELSSAAAAAQAQAMMLWLAGFARQQPSAPGRAGEADRAVRAAASLLDQRLDQPLVVPDLAREVELSPNYLARCFRRRHGMTLHQYQLRRRVDYAWHLLRTTDLPVGRIAIRVGMPDPHHFNKQFRRVTGQSPTAARRRAEPRS